MTSIRSIDIESHRELLSSEEAGELRSRPAAVHSHPVEEGSHPAAGEEHRIHLAAVGEGNLAVGRNRPAAGRSQKEHQEVGRTGSDRRNRLAEEEHRIGEPRPEDGLTSRPWCRTRDRLHRGST